MENKFKLICENKRFKYYVINGKLIRKSKNKVTDLGYIEDNMSLYKKLCEAIWK
jgi:hypothetical protein